MVRWVSRDGVHDESEQEDVGQARFNLDYHELILILKITLHEQPTCRNSNLAQWQEK